MATQDSVQSRFQGLCSAPRTAGRYTGFAVAATLLLVLSLCGIWNAATAAAASTTTLTLAPQADARVEQAYPSMNYGTATGLLVDSSPAMESYLRFAVSGLSGTVQSAKLRLYTFDATTNGPVVYTTDTSWLETGITWNSRPARTSGALDNKGAVSSNTWVDFDVTAAVQAAGTYSFVLAPDSSDGIDMYAREGAQAPQLEVVVATDSTDTAPPTVALSSPAPGTTYTTAQTVAITAAASDNVGVTKVEFYDNSALKATQSAGPFVYPWAISSANNGTHRWTAKAYDAAGNTASSAPIDLTVNIASVGGSSVPATATAETAPVPHSGDAADDAAIWVHPTNPALSTIIGTDKLGGLAVYDLAGKQLYYYADSRPNNVDIRYNFPLGGQRVTIVTTSDTASKSIRVYKVNPTTRGLEYIAARSISAGIGLYGLCMYHSPTSGKYYVFDSDNSGNVQQWALFDNGAGKVDALKVRSFKLGSVTEGCVADDELGHFYLAEEDVAIWKYGAEPGAGTTRSAVDTVSAGRLTADIEGLAIYYASNGTGYLLASSQGSDKYVIYQREGSNSYLKTITINAGAIDGTSHTDGIDVTNVALGSAFPEGMFVAQDDRNDSGNQNFKLVPWGGIARVASPQLVIDTSWDPRRVGSP